MWKETSLHVNPFWGVPLLTSLHLFIQPNITMVFTVAEKAPEKENITTTSHINGQETNSTELISPISAIFAERDFHLITFSRFGSFGQGDLFFLFMFPWTKVEVTDPYPKSRLTSDGNCKGGQPTLRFKRNTTMCHGYYHHGDCQRESLEPLPMQKKPVHENRPSPSRHVHSYTTSLLLTQTGSLSTRKASIKVSHTIVSQVIKYLGA